MLSSVFRSNWKIYYLYETTVFRALGTLCLLLERLKEGEEGEAVYKRRGLVLCNFPTKS